VWGPSVPHSYNCPVRGAEPEPCACPKRDYCEDCDAQHYGKPCSKTVLVVMAEHLTYKEKKLKQLMDEILDSAEARHSPVYTIGVHIAARIDELADRFGNLGMTRKKLVALVKKERVRRQKRAGRERVKEARRLAAERDVRVREAVDRQT